MRPLLHLVSLIYPVFTAGVRLCWAEVIHSFDEGA
jgi:hypothetical protein